MSISGPHDFEKSPPRHGVSASDRYQSYQPGRTIKSCLECRRRKMRCSRSQPCHNCSRFQRKCEYLAPPKSSATPSPRARNEDLCASDQLNTNHQSCHTQLAVHDALNSQPPPVRRASAVVIDPGAKHDGLYSHDAGDDDSLGLQIGRLKITERIGGLFRPEAGKRVSAVISYSRALLLARVTICILTMRLPDFDASGSK